MRSLFRGGPGSSVVGFDLGGRGCAKGPWVLGVLGHRVADVVVEKGVDIGVIEGVTDEGVGHAVLDGTQVDMRQWRLGRGR